MSLLADLAAAIERRAAIEHADLYPRGETGCDCPRGTQFVYRRAADTCVCEVKRTLATNAAEVDGFTPDWPRWHWWRDSSTIVGHLPPVQPFTPPTEAP